MRAIGWVFIWFGLLLSLASMARPAGAGALPAKTAKETDASAALKKAQRLAREGDVEAAISLLDPFATPSPENAVLISDYIVFNCWAGKGPKAIDLFESLPDTVPRRSYLLRNIAKAYYDRKEFETSARLYAQAAEKDTSDRIAKRGWGLSLLQLQRYDTADRLLGQWLGASPDDAELALLQAEVRFRAGRYTEALHQYYDLVASSEADTNRIERTRESLIMGLRPEQQSQLLETLKPTAEAGDAAAAADYVLVLVLLHQYHQALVFVESSGMTVDKWPDVYRYWMAWAYFKEKRPVTAETLLTALMRDNADYDRAYVGLAHVYAAQGRTDSALALLSDLRDKRGDDTPEMRFATAYIYEQTGRFSEAVTVYDAILVDNPGNKTAMKLRLNALSDLGATSEALNQARETLPEDESLYRRIQACRAVNYIQWNEPETAVTYLEETLADDPRSTLRFEYIAALVAAKRYGEAIPVYEALKAEDVPMPAWVLEKTALAYQSEERPEKALALYEAALSLNPGSREAHTGRVYALQDLRKWREAERALVEMEAETRPVIGVGRTRRFNPEVQDLRITRGWLLANEERLKDADEFFAGLHEAAPANLDIRNARAHVHAWRGWKRQALDEFQIIESMEPAYLSAKPGKIAVMDALARKEAAREELDGMLAAHPRDKRFQRVRRMFQVDGMHALDTEIEAEWGDDGTNDLFLQATFSTPLSLYTRLHAFTLWRRTWNDDLKTAGEGGTAYFRRVGIGGDHIFNDTWELRQQFSFDYHEGSDFGAYTRLRFTPDDYWRVDATVDTFTVDVPARARVRGITAVKTMLEGMYRESEWRDYTLSIGRQWFSDGNNRDEIGTGVSQYLYVKNDWKMRLSGHAFFTTNSAYNDATVDYFNPRNAWGLSVTHMTEQIVYHRYERMFVHRLYLTAGNYQQYGYGGGVEASIRYEQEHSITDTHHLLWAVRTARNIYDGDAVGSLGVELMYQWRF